MSDRWAFLEAILEDPGEPGPLGVYADSEQERGTENGDRLRALAGFATAAKDGDSRDLARLRNAIHLHKRWLATQPKSLVELAAFESLAKVIGKQTHRAHADDRHHYFLQHEIDRLTQEILGR